MTNPEPEREATGDLDEGCEREDGGHTSSKAATKLASAGKVAELQDDGAAIGFHDDPEAKKLAAIALRIDRASRS